MINLMIKLLQVVIMSNIVPRTNTPWEWSKATQTFLHHAQLDKIKKTYRILFLFLEDTFYVQNLLPTSVL